MAPSPAPSPDAEDEFASVNSVLLSSSLLVLIVVAYHINTQRLRHVPESGVAMVLGFVLGMLVRILGLAQEEQLLHFNGSLFFYVLLPPIIFEAGLSLETQMFVDNVGAIFAFAVVGTLISTWVTSWGLRLMAGLGGIGLDSSSPRLAIHCHLFGALISATDPVATIALFGASRFRADPLLHSLINGESVLNDAVAIALFTTLTRHLDAEDPGIFSLAVLGHFTFVSAFSLVLGLIAGAACSWCFNQSQLLAHYPEYEIAAMFLGAYLTFATSQLMGLSGIVALFFFGVVLAQYNYYNLSERSKVTSQVCFGTLAKLAEACVFIYLGVVTALSVGRFHWHFGLVIFTGIVITVARAAHIFPLSAMLNIWRQHKIGNNTAVAMWISGLRGAIAFALSLRIPCSHAGARHGSSECRNSDLLVTTTISIVVATTLIVGSLMEHAMTALQVIELLPPGTPHSPSSASPVFMRDSLSSRAENGYSLQVPLASRACASSPGEVTSEARLPRVGMVGDDAGQEAYYVQAPEENRAASQVLRHHLVDEWESLGPETHTRFGGGARTLWKARGWIYQAFARFDVNHLQPTLGGPCRGRVEAGAMELPTMQVGLAPLASSLPQEEPPPWSRAAIFE